MLVPVFQDELVGLGTRSDRAKLHATASPAANATDARPKPAAALQTPNVEMVVIVRRAPAGIPLSATPSAHMFLQDSSKSLGKSKVLRPHANLA
jgi:hypothetical protein